MAAQHKCERDGGTCDFHEAEVERRSSDRTRITDLQDAIKENYRYIGTLLTFMNLCKGFSMLGSVIILGSYTYTYTHAVASEMHIERNSADITDIREDVAEFRIEMATMKANYQSVVEKLDLQNSRLAKLIEIIDADRKVLYSGNNFDHEEE